MLFNIRTRRIDRQEMILKYQLSLSSRSTHPVRDVSTATLGLHDVSCACAETRYPHAKPASHTHHADEQIARELIEGRIPWDEGVRHLMYSDGFPVWTSKGSILFLYRGNVRRCFLTGDFNDWTALPMKRSRSGIWFAEVPVSKSHPKKLGYKFMFNDGAFIADPMARCFNYDAFGEISYIRPPHGSQYLMRWNDFESPQGLKSRPIHVLVPPTRPPYDVLYVHDGQNLFSRDSICGGWKLCDNMRKVHGDFLIVGVWNCEDRMCEYTHTADTYIDGYHYNTMGQKYAAFVEETVRPFIESRFRTTTRAGLMGSSLGGLISLYISNRYPDRYAAVFALSPTTAWGRFGDDHGVTIRDYYEKTGHQNTFLYIDHGGEFPSEGVATVLDRRVAMRDESEWASTHDNCCYTFDFVSALVEIGYRQNIDLLYQFVPGARHAEDAWAARVSKPLRLFMKRA